MSRKPVSGYKLIFGYLGQFLLLIGVIMLVPLTMCFFYPEERSAIFPFAIVAAVDFTLGLFLHFLLLQGKPRSRFTRHQDSHLLVLIWIFAILSGAMPFFIANLTGHMEMNFSEAIFEASSAYTTTGLTSFKDFVDGKVIASSTGENLFAAGESYCPHVFTFHRAFMQFIGGMGLVLLVASILGGGNGISLYESEGHSDKLLPNIAKSAKLIFGIYSLYTVLGTIALWIAGMSWFDAVTTSMSALSGGGFSCRSANIASYRAFDGTTTLNGVTTMNSLAVDIIMIILVLLSAISFVSHTFLLRGKFKLFLLDDEHKFMFPWILGMTALAFIGVCLSLNPTGQFFDNAGEYLRDSAFYVVGSVTTSGFANTANDSAFALANLGRPLLMICTVCMLIGGGMGSTAGGIKIYRIVLALKEFKHYVKTRFAPAHQQFPKTAFHHGQTSEVSEKEVYEAFMYMALFIGVFITLTAVLTFCPGYGLPQYGIASAAFDVASAISNTGLGLNDFVAYGATHQYASHVALWTLSIGMILGRLEILPFAYWFRNLKAERKYRHDMARAAHSLNTIEE